MTKIERLPPHSIEDEQGVLGCVLLSPECLQECRNLTTLHFYDLRHRTLYGAFKRISSESIPIDLITLQSDLKKHGEIEECGGLGYISTLSDAVPSAANLRYYLNVVIEKYLLRKMVQNCAKAVARIYDYEGDTGQLFQQFQSEFGELFTECAPAALSVSKSDVANAIIDKWEKAAQNPGQISGIDTGLIDLNKMTWGWQNESLIIIGARPSRGKTALLIGFARAAAIENDVPTLFITLESSIGELTSRLACQISRANQMRLRGGMGTERDISGMPGAFSKINSKPIHFVDCSGQTIGSIHAAAAAPFVKSMGIKLIIVDYLQKIKANERNEKKTYEVAQASEGLKVMAKEFGVPVISAAQLNREPEKNKGRMPTLSDLSDSGQIERDADIVGLIHTDGEDYSLVIAKHRDGPVGIVPLHFTAECARFDNAAKIDHGDYPRRSSQADP